MPHFDRKSKKWRGVILLNGKRKTKLFKLKTQAKAWEAAEKERLKNPLPLEYEPQEEDREPTLREAMIAYLRDCQQQDYHKNVIDHKVRILSRLLDQVGYPILSEINVLALRNFVLSQPTPTQKNRARKELHALFAYCQTYFGLQQNLAAAAVPKKVPEERKPQPVPTEKEVGQLLLACNRWDRNFITAYCLTGGRKGELLRWTWTDDINFEQEKVRLGTKKTRTREIVYRWVPMGKMLRQVLKDQYKTKLPYSDYVFQCRSLEHKNYGDRFSDRRHFIKTLSTRVLGEDRAFGYHGLRRFFTSIQADKYKTSLPVLQKLLGHSSPRTTEKYLYNISEDAKTAIEKMDELEIFSTALQRDEGEEGK